MDGHLIAALSHDSRHRPLLPRIAVACCDDALMVAVGSTGCHWLALLSLFGTVSVIASIRANMSATDQQQAGRQAGRRALAPQLHSNINPSAVNAQECLAQPA